MEINPEDLTIAERYKLLIGGIVPRPIALVSTISPSGSLNVAPFSFFCGIGSNPMSLAFCPANKDDGRDKDTLRNVLPPHEGGTGEFVVNAATEAIARRVAAAAEPLPFGESEFDLVGFTPAPSRVVRPPGVLESPMSFECRTRHILRLNPGAPSGGNVVIGEVVWIRAAQGLIDARYRVDPDALQAIARMGGFGYCRTRDRFELPMGRSALDKSDAIPPGDVGRDG